MAEVAGLGLKIDSTEAKKGADEVIRALQGVLNEAKKVTGGVDEASNSFEKLKKGGGILQSLKDNWMAVTAGVAAFGFAMKKVWDTIAQEGKEQQMERGLDRMLLKYKLNYDAFAKMMQAAANYTISKDTAVAMATKGMAMGIDPSQILEMVTLVKKATDAMGLDFETSMKQVETAAMTGMGRPLKDLAIVPDFKGAIDAYEDVIGVQKEVMTLEEKEPAHTKAILDALRSKYQGMGDVADKTIETQKQWAASVSDLKDKIDGGLLATMNRLMGVTQHWSSILVGGVAAGLAFFAIKAAAATFALYATEGAVLSLSSAMGVLNTVMLRNPVFWIALVIGAGAAAWWKYKDSLDETIKSEEKYNAMVLVMPLDKLAKEKEALEAKIKALDEIIEREGKIAKFQTRKVLVGAIDINWAPTGAYQSEANVEEATKERTKAKERLGTVDTALTQGNEAVEKRRIAATEEQKKTANKNIEEMYNASLAKQASTEAQYLDLKKKEMLSKYGIIWDDLTDQHKSQFVEMTNTEWTLAVDKAANDVKLKTGSALRQMAADLDSAKAAAGGIDEKEAVTNKYQREKEALTELLSIQEKIAANKKVPEPERMAARGAVGDLTAQIKQKAEEERLVKLGIDIKYETQKKDIAIKAQEDIAAASERLNQERVQSGEMTELAAVRAIRADREELLRLQESALVYARENTKSLLEQAKIEGELQKIYRDRAAIKKMTPYEEARAVLTTEKKKTGQNLAELALESQKVESKLAARDITPMQAAQAQIPLLEKQYAEQASLLKKMPRDTSGDVSAWTDQAKAVEEVNTKLIEQRKVIEENGTAVGGLKASWYDFYASAEADGKQWREFGTNMFKGMEDAIVSFSQTGKLSFRSLADSIIADLTRIMIKKMMVGFFGAIFGGPTGAAVGSAAATTMAKGGLLSAGTKSGGSAFTPLMEFPSMSRVPGLAQGGIMGLAQGGIMGLAQGGIMGLAQGGIMGLAQGGIMGLAQGGILSKLGSDRMDHRLKLPEFASGGVVRKPTLGWIGEAGYPEAVVPLKQGGIPVQMEKNQGLMSTFVRVQGADIPVVWPPLLKALVESLSKKEDEKKRLGSVNLIEQIVEESRPKILEMKRKDAVKTAEKRQGSEDTKRGEFPPGHMANVLPFRRFAEGGVVTQHTFAELGEGGIKEAVIPLKSGAVPVQLTGVQTSGAITVNVPVTIVQGSEKGTSDVSTAGAGPETARALSDLIRTKVVEVIQDQRRAGGLLHG